MSIRIERFSEGIREEVPRPNVLVIEKSQFSSHLFQLNGYNRAVPLRILDLPNLYLVCGGEIHYPPRSHEGSASRYLIERPEGNDIILVGALPQNERTSQHKHPENVFEHYFVYTGRLRLFLGENGEQELSLPGNLENPAGVILPPGVRHYGLAEEGPSLMYIRMLNGALHKPESLHIR